MEVDVPTEAMPQMVTLPVIVPPSLSLDQLQSILAGCGANITIDELQSPSASIIVQIYTALLRLPLLQNTLAQLELEKRELERKNVDMEMQLNDAERLKDEAEKRAQEDRIIKDEAIKEKSSLSSQLAETRGTLQGLQSTAETGLQQSASVKGQLEKLQQEKRDILEVLEREKIENARRAEEIDNLTLRSREARNDASRLVTELQELKSSESTSVFKIQTLEQQLALKTNDATWAYNELKKATDELAQSRNNAHNEHSTLTTQLLQANQSLEASQSKAASLQSAYDATNSRLEEAMREKAELRQKLVEQESSFASEMDTQQRLSKLMEQSKESAEKRMAEIEEQWEVILQQHREREEMLRYDVLAEKQSREEVERKKEELQLALDRLAESVGIEINPSNGFSSIAADETTATSMRPSTPQRSFISLSNTSTLMSPTAALASKVQKSGKSFTQVYAELARTQEELRREKIESNRIGGVLEQVMADLQERGPALVAQREECEQMNRDLEEMSITLARACEERDICEREAKTKKLEAEASLRESKILSQHVLDLMRQVRELTREIAVRDDPSAAAQLEDDGSQVEMINGSKGDISDTQAVITNELVTFRSLTELVTQNGRLIRVVRELGAKMEAKEQDFKNRLEEGESEAVAEARELISRLQDEVRAERTRAEGIRRERDMFRSMCASGSSRNQPVQQSAGAEVNLAHITLTQQYSQLQSQFEALRTETSRDMDRLKEEAYQARSEASKSALSSAKEKAKRESVEERLFNAQQTYQMARRELEEVQKRFNSMHESLTRQEIASHSLTQQVLKATSNEERLRNEVSNLSAEKRLHQQTAERLLEEKKMNTAEKANLSELLRNVQSMQSELEKSSAESKRRLESQSERLEDQCKELRSRLAKKEEDHRQIMMRRELETNDLQMRLNRASEDLSKSKEGLVAAQTSVQHLTTRNEELQKQINSKEEKLAVYERRMTGSSNGGDLGSSMTGSSRADGSSSGLTIEQQLQVELADLKGELRGAQTETEQARGHVEQFKAIAAANEEALSQLQSAYDQYRTSTEASLAGKTAEVANTTERLSAMASELNSAQQEASTVRQELEANITSWKNEKRVMEDAMTELGGVEDRSRVAQEAAQEEVQRQMKLTQEAHSKYEAELVAHAEDVKAISRVKEELELIRTQIIQATKEKETALGNLASSRDSWESQKALYENEHEELKKVNVEIRGQNDALHQHLEALQSQTNEIRQAASGGIIASSDIGDSSFSQSGNEELLEVIKYLRREKKIVDLQVEVREQECARLRQSVEHLQKSLDESRMQLSKEREQHAGASVSAQQHAELMEKINQLSILRESNTTLRDETERAIGKVRSLETQVEVLTSELMPLREELRIKTVELEASENQLRISQEDNKRWQGRTQSILQQYNRIDPEDLKKLQEKKEEAEKELIVQKQALEEMEKEVAAARLEVQNKQGQFDRLRAQSIERIKGLNEKNANLNIELEQIRNSQQQLQEAQNTTTRDSESSLQVLKTENEALQSEKAQLETRVNAMEAEKVGLTSRLEELEMKASSSMTGVEGGEGKDEITATPATAATQESIQAAVDEAQKMWDEEKKILEEKRQVTERREQLHLQKAKEFNTMMKAAIKERDELKVQMTQGVQSGADQDSLDALRQRIAELENEIVIANARIKELEEGRATPEVSELQQKHQNELREQESRLSTQFNERQRTAVEIAVNKAKAAATAEAVTNANTTGGDQVEEQVQSRLKIFEDERQAQLQSALEAKEKELKVAYEEQLKARYEAGKEEASLRNKLILKSKDNKIEKLTAELNTLKGISPTIPTAPNETSTNQAQTGSPVVLQIAGTQRPIQARPLPVRPANSGNVVTPAGPARGIPGNRGGGPDRVTSRPIIGIGVGNVQKRKLEGVAPSTQSSIISGGSNGATEGGGVPKRPRPTVPITIRGGASSGSRGGRGGGQAGT